MTTTRERHIERYASRQQQIDELLANAREHAGEGPDHADARDHLDDLEAQRDALGGRIDELKRKREEEWNEEDIWKENPMEIWDVVAEQAEKLLEKLSKK